MLENIKLYKVKLSDGKVTLARYYNQVVALDRKPGFELRSARFCDVSEVTKYREITEAEASEKYGY